MIETNPPNCPVCGLPQMADSKFCPSCGRPVGVSRAATPTLTAVTPAPPVAIRGERTSPALIALVVLTGILAIGVVGYALGPGHLISGAAVAPSSQSTAAATSTGDPVQETPGPAISEPPVSGGVNLTAKLGEKVPLHDAVSGTDLGSVSVVRAETYTTAGSVEADPGKVFVGVVVRYDAVSGFSYDPFDWVTHDASGEQFEYEGLGSKDPELGSGTLAAGQHKQGWIDFEVPKVTPHLWIDYQNGDGSVVFTVKLY